ncbi:MAG: XRE family transcriptional regulator [Pseudomonadota bacterium]
MAMGDRREATLMRMPSTAPGFGSEVRELRRMRGLTLKRMSAEAGVSLSHLSAIERGVSNPSMEVIGAIAAALEVSPDWFFARRSGAGPLERASVVRSHERRNLNVLYGQSEQEMGYADELLSSSIGGLFYMGLARYAPGAARAEEPLMAHEGDVHGLVIEGEIALRLGDEEITLRNGDSFSFDGRIPHRCRNRTTAQAVLVWAICPVIIPQDIEADDTETLSRAERASVPGPRRSG